MPTKFSKLRPVHPFPARMASSIVWRRLRRVKKPSRVLDPMAGSGTTVVVSRLLGHQAVGFDTDPLALLIAEAWSADVDSEAIVRMAPRILARAISKSRAMPFRDAYPARADEETRAFVRYWFDRTNRRQLTALASEISRVKDKSQRTFFWCAFSRLIITKSMGASLAMDVSHSRPHKAYDSAPLRPFKKFLQSVDAVLRGAPFVDDVEHPRAIVCKGDARRLPIRSGTMDYVITSPPYLNAIDYLRGHKFSLVWMGHRLGGIRQLRSTNVGAELSVCAAKQQAFVAQAVREMGAVQLLESRVKGMLARYVVDMNKVLAEISRVLKRGGEAVLVVGDSTIRDIFIENSRCLIFLGERNGLSLQSMRRRSLPDNRRYLPPPGHRVSGKQLRARMRKEVILVFSKPMTHRSSVKADRRRSALMQ
jgi:SAM-dependent methyltransferase